MDKGKLIELCKYYKGEKDSPYSDEKLPLWKLEKVWVEEASKKEPSTLLVDYSLEFMQACPELSNDKVIPLSLKALIFSRYVNSGGSDEGFKEWIRKYYRIK